MALQSLGKVSVTTAGTPVRLTANESVPATTYGCQSISFQTPGENTGQVYVGSATMNTTTLAGVYLILGPNMAGSVDIPQAPAGLNAATIYLDADTSGNVALVSVTVQ